MPAIDELTALLEHRVAILDGATATVIQSFGLGEEDYRGERFADHPVRLRGNGDLLNLTRPDIVEDMHLRYLRAGADLIETNTFIANRISQTDYGLAELVPELNRRAVEIAGRARERHLAENERPVWIVGSMGPTNRMASLSPSVEDPGARNVSFSELRETYREQAAALTAAGTDLLLLETVFDALNCRAAIAALRELEDAGTAPPPLMISVTIGDASGRTLSGQTMTAFAVSVAHARPFSLGINCSFGADALLPHLRELAVATEAYTSCHPNAGLPDPLLPTGYKEGPADTAVALGRMADAGLLNIAGGCCGTDDAHIRAIAARMAGAAPRRPSPRAPALRLAGLEPCVRGGDDPSFLAIGERTNVAGSRRFRRLVREEDYAGALAIARAQVEDGAQALDVNFDDGMLDAPACMTRFCRLLAAEPDIARVPVMIDSSDWRAIEAGLANLQGKPIVNSISLKEGPDGLCSRGRHLARVGAAMVVMAFDERGQAVTRERKASICRRAYRLLTEEAGVDPQDIVFDANVLTVGTGMEEHAAYAADFVAAVREIKATCPGARCSGGISNVSFAFRGNRRVREAMNAAFLHHARAAGLDMGIVNPAAMVDYADLDPSLRELVDDLLLDRRPDATERLTEYARSAGDVRRDGPAPKTDAWRGDDVDGRLAHALRRGVTEHLAADLEEAVGVHGSALAVIEGPLMAGMRRVGELFGTGEMFLPQVVKTARVMKRAVAILAPLMAGNRGDADRRATAVLATVAGDVHDIGKNIVAVILSCNGYRVVDLGEMVPAERILAAIEEEGADLVGLSGLITPSLTEMIKVAEAMEDAGHRIPLLVGGATTSTRHTAVKIAPAYAGPVARVSDASRVAGICNDLLGDDAERGIAALREEQETLRRDHHRSGAALVPLAEARRAAPRFDWESRPPARPYRAGIRTLDAIDPGDLVDLVDWSPFLHAWGIKGTWPAVGDHPRRGEEARRLIADGRRVLEELVAAGVPDPAAVYAILPAAATGDDLHLRAPAGDRVLHCLRQQRRRRPDAPLLCLADFVAPAPEHGDHLGLFAATAGRAVIAEAERRRTAGDDYGALLVQALADRLAEAATEFVHRRLSGDWDGGPTDAPPRGIRPAIGYPSMPDHSEKRPLWELLDVEERLGCRLTESCAIAPPASTCGLVLFHPDAAHFAIERIGRDQLSDYAGRKGQGLAETETWLARLLRD